jgi:hypothetical protein
MPRSQNEEVCIEDDQVSRESGVGSREAGGGGGILGIRAASSGDKGEISIP